MALIYNAKCKKCNKHIGILFHPDGPTHARPSKDSFTLENIDLCKCSLEETGYDSIEEIINTKVLNFRR